MVQQQKKNRDTLIMQALSTTLDVVVPFSSVPLLVHCTLKKKDYKSIFQRNNYTVV